MLNPIQIRLFVGTTALLVSLANLSAAAAATPSGPSPAINQELPEVSDCPAGVPLCNHDHPEDRTPVPFIPARVPKPANAKTTPAAAAAPAPSSLTIDVGSKPAPDADQVRFTDSGDGSDSSVASESDGGKGRLRRIEFTADSLRTKQDLSDRLKWVSMPTTPVTCFNTWYKTDSDGNLTDQSTGYTGPTYYEASRDPNHHQSEAQREAALKPIEELMNRCFAELPPIWTPEMRADLQVEQIHDEVARTHECPKNFDDIDQLKIWAEVAIAKGYDIHNLPTPGVSAIECGYNSSNNEWFSGNAVTFVDDDHFYTQGSSNLSRTCNALVRDPKSPAIFYQQGKSCQGKTSYRSGGSTGDSRMIPLGHKVWIETFFNREIGTFYYGLVIEP